MPPWRQAFLTALAPADSMHCLAPAGLSSQADKAMRNSAEQQLERSATRRRLPNASSTALIRQSPRCRRLERRWEAALNEVRAAEEALARQSLSTELSRR